jgi:hypothetical protein
VGRKGEAVPYNEEGFYYEDDSWTGSERAEWLNDNPNWDMEDVDPPWMAARRRRRREDDG